VVRILVNEEGLVEQAFVIRDSELDAGFEEASLTAIRKWKYSSGIQNGRPVAVWVHVPIVFKVQ
jgi:protein TonB